MCLSDAQDLSRLLDEVREFRPSSSLTLDVRVAHYNAMLKTTDDDPQCKKYAVKTPLLDAREVQLLPFPQDSHYDHYMSTLWFLQELTDISIQLLRAPNKKERLLEALSELNKKLPASAYIPFNKKFTRDCAVLHIPLSEVKVFKTKERAPFLICIEVYNPYEELARVTDVRSISQSICTASGLDDEKEHDRSESILVTASLSYGSFQQIMSKASEQISLGASTRPRAGSIDNLPSSPIVEAAEEEEETKAPPLDAHYSNSIQVLTKRQLRARGRQTIAYVYGEEGNKLESDEFSSPTSVPSQTLFGETSQEQKNRLRQRSPFGHFHTWSLIRIIVKSGDDLKQEQLAMQLISQFQQIFEEAKLPLWLRPYDILATGPDCGILECVPDAMSIDALKRSMPKELTTLREFFTWQFGGARSSSYIQALNNFVCSLAGYSLVCFILQIKDRHNGNILLDSQGHIIHIDFGFLISNAPGKGIKFEQAPFKLTSEFVEIMGGVRSPMFMKFRKLCVKGFRALKKKQQKIWMLLEMMRTGAGACLPCFIEGEPALLNLRERFNPREHMNDADCKEYINRLIDDSFDHWTTTCYDRYQRWCQDIM